MIELYYNFSEKYHAAFLVSREAEELPHFYVETPVLVVETTLKLGMMTVQLDGIEQGWFDLNTSYSHSRVTDDPEVQELRKC